MKKAALLAIIVGLSAVSMAVIYASDLDPTSLALATPSSEKVGMYGHIEFVHADSFGNIIGYYQTDNFITDMGASCAALRIFDSSGTGGTCSGVPTDFLFIALSNVTSADDVTVTALADETGSTRILDSDGAGITSDTGLSSASVLIATPTASPFVFLASGGNVSDNIFKAGLFDSITGGNVFAIQNVTSDLVNLGIDVNDGDSLAVTWDITVG